MVTSSLALALAVAPAPSACATRTCTLLGCDPLHARITAHVKAPLGQLLAAKTTVCWREVCADLEAVSDAGTSSEIAFDRRVSLLLGEATASAEGNDASRLEIGLRFFTRGRDGDFVYTRQANGDRYRITVVARDGAVLFDAGKAVSYEESYPNGPDCDPDPCRRVAIDLVAP